MMFQGAMMASYQTRNTLRSIPMFRSAVGFFGPSKADHLTGDLRRALQFVEGWARQYADACAALGTANRKRPDVRRVHQAAAMRTLNAVRAAMRANARAVLAAQAGLLLLQGAAPALAA